MFNIIIIILIHLFDIVCVFTSVYTACNPYWNIAFGNRREKWSFNERKHSYIE
jgi:hypothetical protein